MQTFLDSPSKMKKTKNKVLASLLLLMILTGLVVATDEQSSLSSSSSSSTSSSEYSSSSSQESSSSSTIYASTSSSQVSSSKASSSSSSSSTSIPLTWQKRLNSTVGWLNSILPLFGDLITGLGNYLMWPVIYLGIIVTIGATVMVLVGIPATLVTGAAYMVIRKFGKK
jgi:hypothetical protein